MRARGFRVERRSRIGHVEADHQAYVFDILRLNEGNWSQLKWAHSSLNGARRSPKEGGRLKRQGMTAGIADICVPFPINEYHGLWVELKIKPNKCSVEQIAFLEEMEERGFKTAVAWSGDEVLDVIEKYLHIKLDRFGG